LYIQLATVYCANVYTERSCWNIHQCCVEVKGNYRSFTGRWFVCLCLESFQWKSGVPNELARRQTTKTQRY